MQSLIYIKGGKLLALLQNAKNSKRLGDKHQRDHPYQLVQGFFMIVIMMIIIIFMMITIVFMMTIICMMMMMTVVRTSMQMTACKPFPCN